MDKISRLRSDIDVLEKRLANAISGHNIFVAEQQDFNDKVSKNMELVYKTFIEPEIKKQEKAKKNIIVPGGLN